jgi:hypothetical protein
MSDAKSDVYEAALLDLIFLNANLANLGDATGLRGSTAAGSLFFSLHSADPGEAGTQATNEVAYTSYARVGVARSGAGFVRTGNSVSPAGNVDFPTCTGGSVTATHFGIGTAASGAGTLLYKGAISPTISITNGTPPRIASGTNVTEN